MKSISLTNFIFSAKIEVMNKGMKILNVVILSVVVVTAGIFVFSRFFYNNKNLFSYLPLETKAYFEFDPHNKNLLKLYSNIKRSETRFNQLLNQAGFWKDFNSELITPRIKKIGVIVLKFKDKWQRAWLLQSSDINQMEVLLPVGYFVFPLDNDVLVVTQDQELIRFFKKQDKEILIEQSLSQKFIYAKFSSYKFLNSYLSAEYIDYLKQQQNEISYLILENIKLLENEPIYFGLRSDEDQIVFDLQANNINNNSRQKISKSNYQLTRDISDKNLNLILLQPEFSDLISSLSKNFNFNKNFLENKYNFQWQDFEELQKYTAVVFLKNKTDRLETQELLNFENLNWAVLINIDLENKREEFYLKIKNFLNNYLAFKYPSWVSFDLADGSKAYSLIADSKAIEWQTENNIEYFSKDENNFAIAKNNNGVFLAFDKNILNLILNNPNQDDIIKTCPNFKGNELILLNSQKFIHGIFSYIDRTLIFTQDDGLKGCLMW